MATQKSNKRPSLVSRDDAAAKVARPATISLELTAPGVYDDGTRADGWSWSISAAPFRKDASGNRTIPADPGGLYKVSLPLGHGAQLGALARYIEAAEKNMGLTPVDGRLLFPGESLGRKCPAGHKVSALDRFCPQCGAALATDAAPAASNGTAAPAPDDALAFMQRDVI